MQNMPTSETYSTRIPVGAADGNQLYLLGKAFLPTGWTYTVSDTGWITTPDTIIVSITHPVPIACRDTGLVVLYAYAQDESFAGDAEAIVFALGSPGDVDYNGTVDSLDVAEVRNWMMGSGPLPLNPDAMDVTSDGRVDVADLTRIVDKVYGGGSLDCDTAVVTQPYPVRFYQTNGTTVVLLDPTRPLRGMQLTLVGSGSGNPVSALTTEIELLTGQSNDTLSVLVADLNGNAQFRSDVAFRIPGNYSVVGGIAADPRYRSAVVQGVRLVGVDGGRTIDAPQLVAHPNPFYGALSLDIALPSPATVHVAVYDVAGRSVRTILDERRQAGWHQAVWDGADQMGAKVKGGIYFVRMNLTDLTGRRVATVRRVVLIK